MKVISLLQPWASLVVMGHKGIETRSWNTKHRGEMLIHASLNRKNAIELAMKPHFYNCIGGIRGAYDLPLGCVIGKVTLLHTVKSEFCFSGNEFEIAYEHKHYNFEITEQELAFGDYRMNRYGWLLANPVKFDKPIPAKGSLGIWDYDGLIDQELRLRRLEQINKTKN